MTDSDTPVFSTPVLQSEIKPGDGFTAPLQITLRFCKNGRELVTHAHNLQDGGFYSGHYFPADQAASHAIEDYLERCREHGVSPIKSPQKTLAPVLGAGRLDINSSEEHNTKTTNE